MKLTPEQRAAVEAKGSAAVLAGAGTGKTQMLSERYLYHLTHHGFSPLQIVAVTFTEKAANELRSRIRRIVKERLPKATDTLSKLQAAQISTIHALAARICREHFEAAEVPPDFTIQDEVESAIWSIDRFGAALDRLPASIFEQIPFSILKAALPALLNDPIAAERALSCGNEDWPRLVETARQEAAWDLVADPQWGGFYSALKSISGGSSDKREQMRQDVIHAMEFLERGEKIEGSLNKLAAINLKGGSAKNWANGDFNAIKKILESVRDWIEKIRKEGLLDLAMGPVDERLTSMLPHLRAAFQQTREEFAQEKKRIRILDFSDLETHALKALEYPEVREYYHQRWKAFLVDEFQDTNPDQAEILRQVSGGSILTIVGDGKQSIYGFRRADREIFQQFANEIHDQGGAKIDLNVSFRTHENLVHQVNSIFAPLLGEDKQDLTAARKEPPHPAPHIQAFIVDSFDKKSENQQAEANHIARTLRTLLDSKTPVFDKGTGSLRPMRPGDIAILSRTWAPLDIYGETLEAYKIPALHIGGGHLLDTREAKDAWAMLRFLADERDDTALIAVLRAPWFAISDRILFSLANARRDYASWWELLKRSDNVNLVRPKDVLSKLLSDSMIVPPSRLLQQADRLTGYSAVIANLPGAERRLADWRGFFELLRDLEQNGRDTFTLVRRLKRIEGADVEIPRPPLEAENAVSLMTIHAAKGLEWPVVIVPDLMRKIKSDQKPVYFDPMLGAAIPVRDEHGEKQKSVLYIILERAQKRREKEEIQRLLYVALTRARDRLILTAAASNQKGGEDYLYYLRPGLEAAKISIESMPCEHRDALPPKRPDVIPMRRSGELLLGPVGSGLFELPASALSEYAHCPKRFHYEHILEHPGFGEKTSHARELGTLTHLALENDIYDLDELINLSPTIQKDEVKRAQEWAKNFRDDPAFEPFRDPSFKREVDITLKVNSITFIGKIDLLGPDFVLDYKTDEVIEPARHLLQLWIYAASQRMRKAHIAYLRGKVVHSFSEEELDACEQNAHALVKRILDNDFTAAPSKKECAGCPYNHKQICENRFRS